MKRITAIRLHIVLVLGPLVTVGALIGCNSKGTDITPVVEYRVSGALVQEMNVNYAFAAARLWRNDTMLTSATLHVAGVPMAFFPSYQGIDSSYQALISPAASHAGAEAYFKAADASRFKDSVLLAIVDTFHITDNFSPANHLLQGTGQVSLEWTAAANAQGYVIAAVKASQVYLGVGYSALAATGVNSGTIPPEAFIDPITSLPDTGLYNIYVYAYSGAPDSTLAGKFLPTPLPFQLANNVLYAQLRGRFGTLAVTLRDTVRVVLGR